MKTWKIRAIQQSAIICLIACPLSVSAEFSLKNPLGNILQPKKEKVKEKATLFNILVEERKEQEKLNPQTKSGVAKTQATKVNLLGSQEINKAIIVTANQKDSKSKDSKIKASKKSTSKQMDSILVSATSTEMVKTAQPQRAQIGVINCLSQPSLTLSKTLELIQAVEKAVCFNPETNSAWVQAKIQAAQLGMSKSSYYPQISSTANYNWGKDDYQVKNRNDLSYDTNTRRYGITLQANWLLYDFGTRKAQVNEADKLLAMSLSQQNQILQETILKTIVAYYQVIQIELKQENIQQLVEIAKQNYNIANARYKAGAGIKSDELQMSANLAKAKSDLTRLNGDLKIAKGNLATLMGEPAYQDFKINPSLRIPSLLNLREIKDLINESAQVNPKFKAARLAVEAAQAKVKSTKTSQYPSVSLMSSMGNSKQLGESPFANNTQQMQAGVQVSFPIFDGYNNKYQVRAAQENLKLKQLAEEQTKLQNNADIWKSYNELQAMHANLLALKNLNESASKAFEVSQGRYKAGVGNLLEMVNAQNVYIEARLNFSTALTEFLVIRYQLLANIGNLNIWGEDGNNRFIQ